MPNLSSGGDSASVFHRLTGGKKQDVLEIQRGGSVQERFNQSTPLVAAGEGDRSKALNAHRRESSILSLPNSVKNLGHEVRRSASLRSHRTQRSGSSIGHRPRYPSSGNLLVKSPETSPTDTAQPEDPQEQTQTTSAQQPPRSRGKLSISARSLSQRFKSTERLPLIQQSSETPKDTEVRPPLPTATVEPPKTAHPMLATSIPKRAPPDRPNLSSQASFARDAPSSYGHANGAPLQHVHTASAGTMAAGSANPNSIYQSIHDTSSKRMATIDYLRKVHEGNLFYFSTLHYAPASLHTAIPSLHTHKLGRRAANYLALGYSLPLLLDMNSGSALEYLKALTALLQEFETYQNLSNIDGGSSSLSRARVGQMFKSGMGLGNRSGMRTGRRSSAATDSIAFDASKANLLNLPSIPDGSVSPLDAPSPIAGHDFHHLLTPHLPFDPDFNTVFATLCDTLIDMYANLLGIISGPESCSPMVGEAFAKADKAVRKILVANVMREFEDGTRQGVKAEVAGLGRLVLGGLM